MEARELPQPQPQAFELVLRIRHPSMDPGEISRLLQVTAEHCFKAGEPRKSSQSVHAETYWLATLNPGAWPVQSSFPDHTASTGATETLGQFGSTVLGRALLACAQRFLRPHVEFLRRLKTEGGEVRLLVEVNTAVVDGFTLTPELGREIHSLGIPIDFEFTPA